MKNKRYKSKWLWICFISGLFLFVCNIIILVCLRDCPQEQSAWLTLFGGWLGFCATLIVGLIAYCQSKKYKEEADQQYRFIDLIVEKVEVINYGLNCNVLGRRCLEKEWGGVFRFLVRFYSVSDNAVFDFKITKLLKGDKIIVAYNWQQPIQRDQHGKTFLIKNEFADIVAEIPNDDDFNGKYTLILQFKNQYGDTYEKEIVVYLANNFVGKVKSFTQGRTYLVKKENQDGQAENDDK